MPYTLLATKRRKVCLRVGLMLQQYYGSPTREWHVFLAAGLDAQDDRGAVGWCDDVKRILASAESPVRSDFRTGFMTAARRVAHHVNLLMLSEMAVAGPDTQAGLLSTEERTALSRISTSLGALEPLVARLRQASPAWRPIIRSSESLEGGDEHGLASTVLRATRAWSIPKPTGLEMAALAIIQGLEPPIPAHLPHEAIRAEHSRRERKWQLMVKRLEGN
jgi:hypothetical protein